MLGDLSDLRETFFAARMLREQILAAPVRPDHAAHEAERMLAVNAQPPASRDALVAALAAADARHTDRVGGDWLRQVADAAGGSRLRTGPGTPFQGRAAPPAARIPALLDEMIETLDSPVASETWTPVARAFAAHFLIRLVQPFEAPAAAVGHAVEAALLAADGIRADRMLLPEPDTGADLTAPRPDPDAFVRERAHRLVERLGDTAERLRTVAARAITMSWADERGSGLPVRQRRLVRWLAENAGSRMTFRDYVRLHSGRRAPSLRTLQRDWKALRASGLVADRGGGFVFDPDAMAWGRVHSSRPLTR